VNPRLLSAAGVPSGLESFMPAVRCVGMRDRITIASSTGSDQHKTAGIPFGPRLSVLGVTLFSILVVQALKWFVFYAKSTERAAVNMLLFYALMLVLPFVIARLVPPLAEFEIRWLPSSRWQWLWLLGMASVLLICGGIGGVLLGSYGHSLPNLTFSPLATNVRPVTVIVFGLVYVLVAPVAEEVFWRGYVLPQFARTLGHWSVGLLAHSILFALAHLGVQRILLPVLFVYGLILGAWRIRFGSLLPLVIAHWALNAVSLVPQFAAYYDAARSSYPRCQQIDALAARPPEEALPELIKFLGDSDDAVAAHAIEVLGQHFRSQAEPYLKDALCAGDRRTIDRALFAIEWFHYAGLKPEVRALLWSSNDPHIQLAALTALHALGDEKEGREIAQKHPDERIRNAAKKLFGEGGLGEMRTDVR